MSTTNKIIIMYLSFVLGCKTRKIRADALNRPYVSPMYVLRSSTI